MSTSSGVKTSTVVTATVGVIATGLLAYAIYFDYRRRTDPDFRKALKRESKKQARAAKEEAETNQKQKRKAIREAIDRANEEGYPRDPEEIEAYFMQEVAQGEQMIQEGNDQIETALCFYRALKVYPQPKELINIYDKTVPKPILDVLAEMIAVDPSIPSLRGPGSTASESGSAAGVDE
ncbi:protein import receptor MAS20 [Patellaria atrata CBS 101060]|uniref:Mitochondrial import receptor subunit TOM20 n=1 Tax=Patellaria atrata CBS 101060 TaxID=1346257 RepID=A0A9P4SAD3_9PEZI|nr:protein import receptor MAS20 [Patellaria atrata CBS 101060]